MKKFAVLISGIFMMMNAVFAGGILTNTNQSAQFVRMLSRNASIDLDAVYFNPAGLTQMKNGFYFGFHNQTIIQSKTITSEFGKQSTPQIPLMYDKYVGDVKVPVFPTAFGVYKTNNWAFSVGFGPNAGGGSAKYDHGLPSFEKKIARLVPKLSGLSALGFPVTDYGVDISLEGTSVFWGIQGGATRKINDILSIYLGARYVPTINTYNGSVSNIQFGPTGGLVNGQTYLNNAANTAEAYSQTATATLLRIYSAALGDQYVDTKQTGGGVTPIIGVDIHIDKLNIGLKYEHMTIIGLTNKTVVDDTGLFPDGQKTNSDIPAIIAGGADYQLSDKLKFSGSFNLYMDKNVNWGKNVYLENRTIDKNYVELAFGAEYNLTDNFTISAGYLNSDTGVSEQYQSDFSFSNDSYTTGMGFQWNMNKRLVLDAGMMLTTYKNSTKTFTEAAPIGTYTETYSKDTFTVAFGIGYKIF
jgi:long-chain fatty acid transport protein